MSDERPSGGAAAAAAVATATILLAIVLFVFGGAALWFFGTQQAMVERARVAEMQARLAAERQQALAQQAVREATAAPAAPPAEAPPDAGALAGLQWLAGAWTCDAETGWQEEHWLPARGGMMLGLNRTVAGTGRASFEFLRIEATDDGPVYFASPGGSPATPFAMTESSDDRVVFENLEHDFPQRIIYRLEGPDTLVARIEGQIDGSPRQAEWTWRRR